MGVKFRSGRDLRIDTNPIIRKFYSSINSLFSKMQHIDDMAKVYLLESKCFPHLTYALPALKLTSNQIKESNKAWNSAYRKIFKFNV